MTPPPASKVVKIARDGAEIGEYKYELIAALLDAGVLKKTDHYWMQGMAGWLSLNQFSPPAVSIPKATKTPSGRVWWLIGGFLMPYFFAWRIIFDKAYGFTKTTKAAYSVWLACMLLTIITGDGFSKSERMESERVKAQESTRKKRVDPYDVEYGQYEPRSPSWATLQGQSIIRNVLKAPGSARFSSDSQTTAQKTYDDGRTQFYFTSGWVESQNSFGAMLRSEYLVCFMATDNSSKISTRYLRLDEQSTGTIPPECKPMFSLDPNEVAYFQKRLESAEKGDAQAQHDVATCYAEAKGIKKPSLSDALKWNKRAGEQGHAAAAYEVGLAYTLASAGSGVEKDPATAVTWYKKSAFAGHSFAQFVLGNHYTQGNGVERDLTEAFALLSVSIPNLEGTVADIARKNLEGIKTEMTAAEISKARLRAEQIEAQVDSNKKAAPIR